MTYKLKKYYEKEDKEVIFLQDNLKKWRGYWRTALREGDVDRAERYKRIAEIIEIQLRMEKSLCLLKAS